MAQVPSYPNVPLISPPAPNAGEPSTTAKSRYPVAPLAMEGVGAPPYPASSTNTAPNGINAAAGYPLIQ